MAVSIRKENFIKYAYGSESDKMTVCAEIFVDTADELPDVDGISGRILHQGSIAYVITTGELYVMGSDGRWYSSDGGEIADITSETETANESAQNT